MAYEGKSASAFVDMEIVQQHIQRAASYVAQTLGDQFRSGTEGALRYMPSLKFDSPLEVLFWIWWQAGTDEGPGSELFNLKAQEEVVVGNAHYRVDFLVEPVHVLATPNWKPIAVEVDGHGFHERTREQVATRDSRDRALQAAGWRVFHFSYEEFTQKPLVCISEVFTFARLQLIEASRVKG